MSFKVGMEVWEYATSSSRCIDDGYTGRSRQGILKGRQLGPSTLLLWATSTSTVIMMSWMDAGSRDASNRATLSTSISVSPSKKATSVFEVTAGNWEMVTVTVVGNETLR